MGLFSKKTCAVCGGKIGLLGNRKLADGDLCKDCAKELSPWFEERRQATVDDIRAQLAYREENRAALAGFHVSRTIGRSMKVLLDEPAGLFMVTDASNLAAANPDVLKLSDVTGCDVEIKEGRRELYHYVKQSDGSEKRESYSPKRYQYSYDFRIAIYINHPWFREIRFALNEGVVDVDYREPPVGLGGILGMAASGAPVGSRLLEGSTMPPPVEVRRSTGKYAEFEDMANDIRAALLQGR